MHGLDGAKIDLYLASSSPRRRELLSQIGIKFSVIGGLEVNESLLGTETPQQYVFRLARDKALAGYARLATRLSSDVSRRSHMPSSAEDGLQDVPVLAPVLGADTCVVLDDEILIKPVDREDGLAMLRRLSGRSHRVFTAICLVDGRHEKQRLSQSVVTFKTLSQNEIEHYWESGEPVDKAGAYAIQGGAARFVTSLHGSYTGVVGLPLYELSELLQSWHEDAADDKK